MFNVIIPLLGVLALAVVALVVVRPIRRAVISRPLFATYRKVLPQMSDTERDALEAGTVWWEGELFRGKPDWQKLHAYPVPKLTRKSSPSWTTKVEEACRLVDDWKVTHELYDLPPEAWRYIKDKGFLGMIIPKKYGGLEFSAYAHSQVVTKLSTRSSALVGVGDGAELARPGRTAAALRHREQKNHYLPRLAKGHRDSGFRADQPVGRFRRRVDSRQSASSARACGRARKCSACG
jgi:acyl-CoA dehydrogenase